MLNIILFGPPGSGKGTQAVKLAEKFNLVHLSTGDIFRTNFKNNSDLGRLARNYMDKGELVPDDVTIRMLEEEVNKRPDASGFIFDGFPRTIAQAAALDTFLSKKKTAVTLTLALEADDEELTKRIMLRGKTSGRSDDTDETIIRNRIKEYNGKTAPLKEFYLKQGKLREINGIGSINEIFSALCKPIEESDGLVKNDKLNYSALLKKFPWIISNNQNAIISPDTDGILCGLFMSYYFNWNVAGYYDGKRLAIKKKIKSSECIFLDMEIFRKEIKSCGQHMVLYNKRNLPKKWNNFSNCINPNILRGFDANKNFPLKYPLATIHLLLCIVGFKRPISLPKTAITSLLYVDGTFKNLLNYPENCISWLHFLDAKNEKSPIFPLFIIFANQKISGMMHDLEDIFRKFKEINKGKKGGDKIKLDTIEANAFSEETKGKFFKLLTMLSSLTGWNFIKEKWAVEKLAVVDFSKRIEPALNGGKYEKIIKGNPVSLAITGTKTIEYTLNSGKFQ